MRPVIETTVALSVVAVVTFAVELCQILLGNIQLELNIGMVVVGPIAHLHTPIAGISGGQWGLHGWALMRLIIRTAIAITVLTIVNATSLLHLWRVLEQRLRLIASESNLLLGYALNLLLWGMKSSR